MAGRAEELKKNKTPETQGEEEEQGVDFKCVIIVKAPLLWGVIFHVYIIITLTFWLNVLS